MRVTARNISPRDHAGPVTVARCANDVRVGEVNASDIARAVSAAVALASDLDQGADDAIVVHNSNNLALRIVPCDIFARVAPIGHEVARFELEIAQRLAETKSPVAALEPRVRPFVYERDGFAITLWSYYEALTTHVSPVDYAHALERLHAGMRNVDVVAPHFMDRVAEAQQVVATRARALELVDADWELLGTTLRSAADAIAKRGAAEQLLHGEPHPGNLLMTKSGPLFIDFETCCRGPVEFDLAHVPEEVTAKYPGADQELLRECRRLVLAMVAAWRCEPGDEFPDRERALRELLRALRDGSPWRTLDVVMGRPASE
jgi:thiamine kinase-like enzyme